FPCQIVCITQCVFITYNQAFGDAMFKWPAIWHKKVFPILLGARANILPRILEFYLTPPYLSAKPNVTHHELQPGDKFLIMASDGMWDELSDEVAVRLVGRW